MPPSHAVAYDEKLLPGPGGWAAALGFAAVLGVAIWPASEGLAIAVAVVAAVVGTAALWWTSPVVAIADGNLRAGRARIPVAVLGDAVALDAPAMRAELGPRLDTRAFVCLRAWARTGVLVRLDDPTDPTPYWLVSTRRPARLLAALADARGVR